MNLLDRTLVIALVAGEHSGDTYGAMIIKQLKSVYPNSKFIGVGGEKMQAAGLVSLMPMEQLSVIGIVNVIKKIPELLRAKNQLVMDILKLCPDCYIGIDAPDFNLQVAKQLKKETINNNSNLKIIQYISPTVWAWRARRIYTVDKATDMVLCIFPFEEKIYTKHGINAKFIGHPLANKLLAKTNYDVDNSKTKIELVSGLDLSDKEIIGVLPGSRRSELMSLADTFLQTIKILSDQDKNKVFVIPLVSKNIAEIWQKFSADFAKDDLPIIALPLFDYANNNVTSIDVIRASKVILCASGTTTLESLLLDTPMVVAYKISRLNAMIINMLIKTRYVAMANILSDKLYGCPLVPEFLQEDVTAINLAQAVSEQLELYNDESNPKGKEMKQRWIDIRNYLKANNLSHEYSLLSTIMQLLGDKQIEHVDVI